MPISQVSPDELAAFFQAERRTRGGQYASRSRDGLSVFGYATTVEELAAVVNGSGVDFRETVIDYVPKEGEDCSLPYGMVELTIHDADSALKSIPSHP